eukprot:TRINITY_DN12518_c0_g1_i1.p2 TRINITY_DN12518_c0_g1~~TRINITY_DN12518_c0_g1_i1.p2  ORF type:complete len:335 (+),score=48.28 TRINITY_DN12518_c0_g1_i1:1499-2503(+)
MEHNQNTRIPLTNARFEESPVGELIVSNSRQGQFSVVVDPSIKEVTIQIRLHTAGFIGNILLWNVSRDIVDHQTVFKTNPVPFTFGQNMWEIKFLKPPSKVPFKLFLTFNIMNTVYSGVLFSQTIISNDELKSNVMNIYDTIRSTATTSPIALQFNRTLGHLTTALGIEYYENDEQLVNTLLFGDDGYVDLVKEKKFLNVFKSYAQLRNAIALIGKPYFKFNEAYIMQRLPTQQRGTFAVTFSSILPGLLVCNYKSGGLFPESKYLGYFASPDAIAVQPYYYKVNDEIRCDQIQPPREGFYQIEMATNVQNIPIHYHIDSWVEASIELQFPLYE